VAHIIGEGDVPPAAAPPVAAHAAAVGRGGPGCEGHGHGPGCGCDGCGHGGWSGRFCQGEGCRKVVWSNYSNSELLSLLEFAHDVLPMSGAE
jgi:hypothetical protein